MLFVSYSGATRDTLETLRAAKGGGRKDHSASPIGEDARRKSWRISCCCGAQESPLDSGNIPVKVALLYVAEVLVLRYSMTTEMPTPHRIAPVKHWRSKC